MDDIRRTITAESAAVDDTEYDDLPALEEAPLGDMCDETWRQQGALPEFTIFIIVRDRLGLDVITALGELLADTIDFPFLAIRRALWEPYAGTSMRVTLTSFTAASALLMELQRLALGKLRDIHAFQLVDDIHS